MLTTLLASVAVAASLADGPPPITVSLNNGGQYNRGEYAQAQFQASDDGYVLLLQTDQNGRIRVLFPLDPGDDNFIRGGKTYKVVGRDSRGSFYLDQAGSSGMVYVAWSKSPFRFADFVRGDHWDYTVFDQYNAADDPESQLTDLVLNFTSLGFDYAIDRYIVYSYSDVVADGGSTYIGVSGWPWPTYYTDGWSVGISIGCCYGYPVYGWGYPWYGWGYPGYGWGYPGYGWGYPAYGYPGYGYPGYGYPGYGAGYPGYPGYGAGYPGGRPPYTFKPGGTATTPGNPYRPRGDAFAPQSSVFQTSYRDRSGYGRSGTGAPATDAATIRGSAEAGRRPAARPSSQADAGGSRGSTFGQPTGGAPRGAAGGTARRPSGVSGTGTAAGPGTAPGSRAGAATGAATGGARRSPTGTATGAAPRARAATGTPSNTGRARGWTADGQQRPAVAGRPRLSPTSPSTGRSATGSSGSFGGRGGATAPTGRAGSSAGRPSAQPQGRPSGGSAPRAAPQGRSSGGSPPAARGGGGSYGGGAARGGAPSGGGGGGGGGRRGR